MKILDDWYCLKMFWYYVLNIKDCQGGISTFSQLEKTLWKWNMSVSSSAGGKWVQMAHCRTAVAHSVLQVGRRQGIGLWIEQDLLERHLKSASSISARAKKYMVEGSLNRNFRQYGELKSSSRVVKSVDRRCNSQKVRRKDDTHAPNVREVTKCCVFS